MIKIDKVSFAYPDKTAGGLTDIRLDIKKGECILVCGRSGCGKTTITRLINGLIPNFFPGQLSGQVKVDNRDVFNTPMYQTAACVGSVFQNPRTQFFNVDTDSEIAFGIENAAMPWELMQQRVSETVEKLALGHLCNRNIFELSGGEKQKIAFASIYAMNPEIYLLDEPSSNLDRDAIEALKKNLGLIKQEGKTIVIAEHRLSYLMDLADRIIYLEQGKIEGIYTPETLTRIPDEKREAMGLRAVKLEAIRPCYKPERHRRPVLEMQNITLKYKQQMILEKLNVKAAQGEIIAVVGQNGAGKTTFSKALCGLHRETAGVIFWKGVLQSKKNCQRRAYLVMQDVNYGLFAESVEAECTFGRQNPDTNLATQTLSELDLLSYRERHPNTLSGGQKQRLAVAVSVMCEKELLVFDEPTSGLDHDSMTRTAELLQRLSEQGKLLFIVTHDYELICRVCTRVIHLAAGKIVDDLMVTVENEDKIRRLFDLRAASEE